MFRRRKAETEDGLEGADALEDESVATAGGRTGGPWDSSEVPQDAQDGPDGPDPSEDDSRIDLGSLVLTAREDVEVQLQVEEATGDVAAVIMAAEDGAAELRAFAAPRNGDIWESVRKGLAGEVAQMGGTATEVPGPFGPALEVAVTVDLPDGTRAQQRSTVHGISGPRWLLRVTLFGRPAEEFDDSREIEQAIRQVVVVRGSGPVPPGDALPLTVPPTARRVD